MFNTADELIELVFKRLKEDAEDPVFWGSDELLGYADIGYSLISEAGDFFIKESMITLKENISIYDLSADLVQVNLMDLLVQKEREVFKKQSGTPLSWDYYGLGKIIVDPIPTIDDQDKTIDYQYRALAPSLSSTGTILNSANIKLAIFHYTIFEAFSKEGDGKDSKKAATSFQLFQDYRNKAVLKLENLKQARSLAGDR